MIEVSKLKENPDRYEYHDGMKCPYCSMPWAEYYVDKTKPDCKKEITCSECERVWRLVEN